MTGSAWLFTGVPPSGGTGGSLRATHLPRVLIERSGGAVLAAYGRRGLPALLAAVATQSRLWRQPLSVASARLWVRPALRLLARDVRGALLDLHDHPRLQSEAFGLALSAARRSQLDDLVKRNVAAFARLAVPSASFAELCELPPEEVIVATNGTDSVHITPAPWRDEPVVGLISGAAPGRGIELLIEAVRRIRADHERVRLQLALAPTGPASRRYLEQLRRSIQPTPWVEIRTVPHAALGAFLAGVQVLAIPHPPNPYHDVATPVKLFDGMAAGRPTVVTPRLEMAAIVRDHDAGLVAAGDKTDDVAAAIDQLLGDGSLRRRLGENARRTAAAVFDWRVISANLARAVLGPEAE